jgi:hypothetical protein
MKKKRTTHKIITNAVHIASLIAAVYILYIWQFGTVSDAPQMLQYVAWVEITNLAQYSTKSAYDHKHGIFDNPVAKAAIQGMQMNDLTQVSDVVNAVSQVEQRTISETSSDINKNMAN